MSASVALAQRILTPLISISPSVAIVFDNGPNKAFVTPVSAVDVVPVITRGLLTLIEAEDSATNFAIISKP